MGYLGLLLLGAAFTAVGLFASTLTRYQILAALIGAGVAQRTDLHDGLPGRGGGDAWRAITSGMNLLGHFDDFSKGILDTPGPGDPAFGGGVLPVPGSQGS